MYLKGQDENGSNWQVGVQNPLDHDQDLLNLKISSAGSAVATSGITKRKGRIGDYKWHHLIDPRTGLSADNNILAATVISDSVWLADVLAKTVLILGKEGINFLSNFKSAEGLLINSRLEVFSSNGMKKYVI